MAVPDQSLQPPSVGRVLGGRYQLVAPIARGGMAEVWEGHDDVLSRPVAVKVLQPHLAGDGVFLERFRREAVTAARLAHPGIVATFDTGYDQGLAFIVMELVRGRNLRQLLDLYGRLEPWQAVAVARQVADALAYAHGAGLVHRDIKPANVLLVEDEWGSLRVKVTDFGIAKAGYETGADLTRTGMVLGTPKYLSPEQIRGREPDPRSDLYSVGVLLYEMLVGAAPFTGDSDMATALAHLSERAPKPSASVRGIPSGLDRVVVDLLAKTPDRRIQSAPDLRERLDELGPLSPPARRRRAPAPPAPPPSRPPVAPPPPAPAPLPAPPAPDTTNAFSASPPTAVFTRAQPDGPVGYGAGYEGWHPGPESLPAGPLPAPVRRFRRNERIAAGVVVLLVVVGAVVAVLTLNSRSHHPVPSAGGQPAPQAATSGGVAISSASVYMDNTRPPDNPTSAPLAIDGNPATVWSTDRYPNPTFGHLYDGIGLELRLSGTSNLHSLTVTSPTAGWSAAIYVSGQAVPSASPLSSWGAPVTSRTAIPSGTSTFDLGGRRAEFVLLWITNLGPADSVQIGEISLR